MDFRTNSTKKILIMGQRGMLELISFVLQPKFLPFQICLFVRDHPYITSAYGLDEQVGGFRQWSFLLTIRTIFMLTQWMGEPKTVQKYADVIYEWSLIYVPALLISQIMPRWTGGLSKEICKRNKTENRLCILHCILLCNPNCNQA